MSVTVELKHLPMPSFIEQRKERMTKNDIGQPLPSEYTGVPGRLETSCCKIKIKQVLTSLGPAFVDMCYFFTVKQTCVICMCMCIYIYIYIGTSLHACLICVSDNGINIYHVETISKIDGFIGTQLLGRGGVAYAEIYTP